MKLYRKISLLKVLEVPRGNIFMDYTSYEFVCLNSD